MGPRKLGGRACGRVSTRRVVARAALLMMSGALSGCYLFHGRDGDVGGGVRVDTPDRLLADAGAPPERDCEIVYDDRPPQHPEEVDLLIMIDNSNSMSEEQASLVAALPELVESISSGDIDRDGVPDFVPVESLHVGVITSDMGTGGFTVPTCASALFGDDGVLLRTAGTPATGCAASYPSFLEYRPQNGAALDDFVRDVGCVAIAGTGGCGFEQPLEAILKSLTPSTDSDTRFFRNTAGHGDGINQGFLREDSVLAVIVVTDENDCSARDPELFSLEGRYSATDLNIRCPTHEEALLPISRYVEGLLDLRRDPGRLVFASIAGVPLDLSGASPDRILADARMQETLDPSNPMRLTPSCNEEGRGLAFPPRRIVEVADQISLGGARSTSLSICQSDFTPAVRLVLEEIRAAARQVCR